MRSKCSEDTIKMEIMSISETMVPSLWKLCDVITEKNPETPGILDEYFTDVPFSENLKLARRNDCIFNHSQKL